MMDSTELLNEDTWYFLNPSGAFIEMEFQFV